MVVRGEMGRNLGLNAVAGKPREMFMLILRVTPRCARAVTRWMDE